MFDDLLSRYQRRAADFTGRAAAARSVFDPKISGLALWFSTEFQSDQLELQIVGRSRRTRQMVMG